MEKLDAFISKFNTSEEIIELVLNLSTKEFFKKNAIVSNAGETVHHFYIITKGYAISFIENENSKQFVRRIFTPMATFGSLASLLSQKPSKLVYKCITDCEFYKIEFDEFMTLAQQNQKVLQLYNKALEHEFLFQEERVLDLSLLNATQRYLKLKKEIPTIENLLPQYYIASYLNVTPVQLSRLRKDLLRA